MSEYSIKADVTTLRSFLKDNDYVIPEYQRPYSWELEHVEQLFEDLKESYRQREGHDYFLGSVVIFKKDKKRYVIDGQQRLITLTLLAKVLSKLCQTYKGLGPVIYRQDQETLVVDTNSIKITSEVLGEDEQKKLESLLIKDREPIPSKFKENYDRLYELIDEYLGDLGPTEVTGFITNILNSSKILPAVCEDYSSAIRIFKTLNARGLSLNDTDIFKAILYGVAKGSKEDGKDESKKFITEWNELTESAGENWSSCFEFICMF